MNVFDEQRGELALYTTAGAKDGATVAILLELLRRSHSVHLVQSIEEVQSEVKGATSLPLVTVITQSGAQDIVPSAKLTHYLLNKYDRDQSFSYTHGSPEDEEINRWLIFLTETVPHSENPADANTPLARKLLTLYLHLEQHLQKAHTPYVVGKKCTLADLAIFPYAAAASSLKLDLERFPEVTTWFNRLADQAAVRKGMKEVHLELENL